MTDQPRKPSAWASAPTPEALKEADKKMSDDKGFRRWSERSPPRDEDESRRQRRERRDPHPDGAIADLRAFAEWFTEVNTRLPFKVGDIVTPHARATLSGRGKPHLVLELAPTVMPDFVSAKPGSIMWGLRPQMRVAVVTDDQFAKYWCEADEYEPWDDYVAGQKGERM